MTLSVPIEKEVYDTLRETFGEESFPNKFTEIIIAGLQGRLEEFSRKILNFEEKYGLNFKEFEESWEQGKIKNPHSYPVESDFMDWEMLEMEKRDLIKALSRLRKS